MLLGAVKLSWFMDLDRSEIDWVSREGCPVGFVAGWDVWIAD